MIYTNKMAELKQKQYYTIEVEGWTKAIFKYKVFAETPEEAISFIDKSPLLEAPRPLLGTLKKLKARVYLLGTNMLKHTHKF
jgi:hypothetical protein